MAYDEEETDSVEVDVQDEDAEAADLEYEDTELNLVPIFLASKEGKEALKKLADRVCEDFDTAHESSEPYRQRIADDWKIFSGELPPKDFPFKHAANAHIPIMLENTLRVAFRVYAEIFGDWQNVYSFLPMGPNDDADAEALSIHGNWQLRNQIPNFKRQQMRGIIGFFVNGDVTFYSYYDQVKRQNCHEYVTPDEFVTPYSYTTTAPDYSDLPYYALIRPMYRHEIEAKKDSWHDVENVILKRPPSWSDEPEMPLANAVGETQGLEQPDDDKQAPYKIIFYEGWLKLPKQDKQRWCRVVFHKETKGILELRIHEEEDWRDRARFDRQMEELQAYEAAMAAYPGQKQQYDLMAADAEAKAVAGMLPPEQVEAAKQQNPPPEPPVPPDWMAEGGAPDPIRMVPIYMFQHGVAIEPLRGNLGLSHGRILADMNRAVNVALSQYTDTATMNNAKVYLYAGGFDPPADFKLTPGQFHKIDGVTPQELQQSVLPIEAGRPSEGLMGLVQNMHGWAQEAVQSPDVLSGEPGKSGETFRGIATRVEQATKQLSVVSRTYVDSPLLGVLRNNARLNAIYLDENEIVSVTDHLGGVLPVDNPNIDPVAKTVKVSRDMYARNYSVELRADLRFQGQAQRIQEADEIVMMGAQHPLLQGNLEFNLIAVKKALEARGRRDMAQLVKPPPPPPPVPGPDGPPPGGPPPGGPPTPPGPLPPEGVPGPGGQPG